MILCLPRAFSRKAPAISSPLFFLFFSSCWKLSLTCFCWGYYQYLTKLNILSAKKLHGYWQRFQPITDSLKFVFSKKATKIGKIFTVNLILCSRCQIDGEDFVNFCGLLRKNMNFTFHIAKPKHESTLLMFTDKDRQTDV